MKRFCSKTRRRLRETATTESMTAGFDLGPTGPTRRTVQTANARLSPNGKRRDSATMEAPVRVSSHITVPPTDGLSPDPKAMGPKACPDVSASNGTTTASPTAAAAPTNGTRLPRGARTKRGAATMRVYCWVSTAAATKTPASTHRPRCAAAMASNAIPNATRSWGWK